MTLKKKAAALAASVGMIMVLGTGLASAEESGHGGHGGDPFSRSQSNNCGNTNTTGIGFLPLSVLTAPLVNLPICIIQG
ncbi:hypothetical protein ACFYN3_31050 [Streptomyces lavendulae]|uniref:hypothetical protein n=1 Tax=Streptomyces lavendulae TaxID=1914 RepID=UPI0036C9CCBA